MITLLAYIFFFIAASASPMQRRWLATKKEGTGQVAFAFWVSLIISILGLVILFISPFQLYGSNLEIIALASVCGIFGAGFLITQYTAQRHVDAGITTLVSNIYTPVTIILATLFLNEALTTKQIIGTLILLVAIVLISKKHRVGRFRFDKYFLMMLASGIMIGFVLSAERALMKTTGNTAGVLISWWSQALWLGIAALITKSRTNYTKKEIAITGVLRFFQAVSYVSLIALVGNLSVVSSVTTFKVVVVFVAAAILLKEREDLPRKVFGSLVAVGGLLLMK